MASKLISKVTPKFTTVRLILDPRTCGPIRAMKDEYNPLPGGRKWDWRHLLVTTIPRTESTRYQEALSDIARWRKPFNIALGQPSLKYATLPRKIYSVSLLSNSAELRAIERELRLSLREVVKYEAESFTAELKGRPEYNHEKWGRFFVRPTIEIDSSVSVFGAKAKEDALRVLKDVRARHGKQHICPVTAVGIQLHKRAEDIAEDFYFRI